MRALHQLSLSVNPTIWIARCAALVGERVGYHQCATSLGEHFETTIRLIAGFLGLASIQGSSDNPFPQFGKEAGMSRLPMDRSRVREVV
ncbi:MAG TPA: hypothetical protein VMV69_24175, partial [Pirellulales bacterium]|nr:hypothetical protein [Pirellulales bacterium]